MFIEKGYEDTGSVKVPLTVTVIPVDQPCMLTWKYSGFLLNCFNYGYFWAALHWNCCNDFRAPLTPSWGVTWRFFWKSVKVSWLGHDSLSQTCIRMTIYRSVFLHRGRSLKCPTGCGLINWKSQLNWSLQENWILLAFTNFFQQKK